VAVEVVWDQQIWLWDSAHVVVSEMLFLLLIGQEWRILFWSVCFSQNNNATGTVIKIAFVPNIAMCTFKYMTLDR
jgi:hypothetical protein